MLQGGRASCRCHVCVSLRRAAHCAKSLWPGHILQRQPATTLKLRLCYMAGYCNLMRGWMSTQFATNPDILATMPPRLAALLKLTGLMAGLQPGYALSLSVVPSARFLAAAACRLVLLAAATALLLSRSRQRCWMLLVF